MTTMRSPAPRFRIYAGQRLGNTATVRIADEGGKESRLDPRFDLMKHSPTGLEWGYEGSGPAQLALAILADATGDDLLALQTYQRFKREIIAKFGDSWTLEAGDIANFAKTLVAPRQDAIHG